MNIEVISGFATAPGATVTALTVANGDTFAAKNSAIGKAIRLVSAWTVVQAVGVGQIVFPSGNDTTRNIRFRNSVALATDRLPISTRQPVQPQELMVPSISGSAVAGDLELMSLLMFYEDQPGIAQRIITPETLAQRAVRTVTVEDTVTPTSGGQYSGARVLTAGSDLLRANTDYAVLGAVVGIRGCALTLRGPDLGNVRVGLPCEPTRPDWTGNYFERVSFETGLGLIPVFNSANKNAIFTEVVQDENLTAVPFSWNLVELAP